MNDALSLLRQEHRARAFFLVLVQSSIGSGAAYIGLLVLAYDRYRSAWGIGLVLLADLLPSMVLGPLFGAVADRFSRKWCIIAADVVRMVGFAGIAVFDSYAATLALALLCGLGTGLFRPAALAAVPGLVRPDRVAPATALFGAVEDIGFTAGPAAAALLLIVVDAEGVMWVNSVSFAFSAILLCVLQFGAAPPRSERPEGKRRLTMSLVHDARDGLRVARETPGITTVLICSSITLLFCGVFNVAELLLAESDLGTSASGFSTLAALFGIGFLGGSIAGVGGVSMARRKRGYLAGLVVLSVGLIGCGLAPGLLVASLCFVATGFGNGLVLVHERLLIQGSFADSHLARIYGVKDALTAWAFGIAFVFGGGVVQAFGTREVLIACGAMSLGVALASRVLLRGVWTGTEDVRAKEVSPASAGGFGRAVDRLPSEDHPDLVAGNRFWFSLFDDLHQRTHH